MTSDQPGDLDRSAASAMWRRYAAATGLDVDEEPVVERFGDSARLADELLDRTRAGWLDAHERYFRRTQAARGEEWSDDLEVVVERFRVVRPPEVADQLS